MPCCVVPTYKQGAVPVADLWDVPRWTDSDKHCRRVWITRLAYLTSSCSSLRRLFFVRASADVCDSQLTLFVVKACGVQYYSTYKFVRPSVTLTFNFSTLKVRSIQHSMCRLISITFKVVCVYCSVMVQFVTELYAVSWCHVNVVMLPVSCTWT